MLRYQVAMSRVCCDSLPVPFLHKPSLAGPRLFTAVLFPASAPTPAPHLPRPALPWQATPASLAPPLRRTPQQPHHPLLLSLRHNGHAARGPAIIHTSSSFFLQPGDGRGRLRLQPRRPTRPTRPAPAVLPRLRPFSVESGRCSNSEETSFLMKCHPSPSCVVSLLLPCPPCSCAALLSSLSALHFLLALLVPYPIVLAEVAPAARLALAPYPIVLADASPLSIILTSSSFPALKKNICR